MTPFSVNINGRLIEYSRPAIMAIINVTLDSFYEKSRVTTRDAIIRQTETFIKEGADIIDIGAYSTRPGHGVVSVADESEALYLAISAIRSIAPDIPLSVDTFRHQIAHYAISEMGADIINDVSFCQEGELMIDTVAKLKAPYVLTHCTGSADDHYTRALGDDCLGAIVRAFAEKIRLFNLAGVNDLIIDPGFGFSKSVGLNYSLLRNLDVLGQFGLPVLVGLSRKSMLTAPLGITPDLALAATTAANTIALLNGASILRVHDVAAARDAARICQLYSGCQNI